MAARAAGIVGYREIHRRVVICELQQTVRIGRRLQFGAIDRQHIISGLYVEARLSQRTAVITARVVAGIDSRDAVAARRGVERPIHTQQSAVRRRCAVAVVAAADISVGIADLSQHLPDQII